MRALLALRPRRRLNEANYPTVCLRCAEALAAISFPPYTARKRVQPKMTVHAMPRSTWVEKRTRDYRPALFLLSALVILADRLSKIWIVHHIRSGSPRRRHPRRLPPHPRPQQRRRLQHLRRLRLSQRRPLRPSSPSQSSPSLIVLAMLWRTGRYLNASSIALALILGGAIGNLYDRARLYYVVDFLEVTIVHYHWPDFNVADSCIVIGACLLLLEIFRPHLPPAE